MRKSLPLLALVLVGCIPPAPINVKRTIEGPGPEVECARAAALAMPGVKGAIVNQMEGSAYEVLVEFAYGIDYVTVYRNPKEKTVLAGAALPKDKNPAVLEERTAKVNAVLDAIQSRCAAHAA